MSGLAPFLHQTGVVSSTWDPGMEGASSGNWGSEGVSLDADVTPLACSCSRLLSCSMVRIASPAHASTVHVRPRPQARRTPSSVSHYHTPSTKLTAYTHTLLWSSFKCAVGFSTSSSFFWKVVVLQDSLLLLSLFAYLLVGADLVESGPR